MFFEKITKVTSDTKSVILSSFTMAFGLASLWWYRVKQHEELNLVLQDSEIGRKVIAETTPSHFEMYWLLYLAGAFIAFGVLQFVVWLKTGRVINTDLLTEKDSKPLSDRINKIVILLLVIFGIVLAIYIFTNFEIL